MKENDVFGHLFEQFDIDGCGIPMFESQPLPDMQREVLQRLGKATSAQMMKTSTFPGEDMYVKFWVLNDGTLIYVPRVHVGVLKDADEHDAFLDTGAGAVLSEPNGEIVVRFEYPPNEGQIKALLNLAKFHGVHQAAVEVYDEGFYVDRDIRSVSDFRRMLKQAKVKNPSLAAQFHESLEEMAKAEGRYAGKVFYHGTPKVEFARAIAKQGIVPDMDLDKYEPQDVSNPIGGRVYVTPDLHYAVIYALGGVFQGTKFPESFMKKYGRYGFVFELEGDQFDDVQPDEDSVGEMVAFSLDGGVRSEELSWLVDLVHELQDDGIVSKELIDEVFDGEYVSWIQMGKIVLDYLSDEQKLALIDAGAHVAHAGRLTPHRIWAIDRNDTSKLDQKSENFFDVAFEVSEKDLAKLTEATATAIKRKQKSINKLFPQFPERVKAVQDKGGLRLKKIDQDTWKWKIHSGTKKDVWYDAVVHFKGVEPLLRKLVADRRLWNKDKTKVNLNKLSREFMKRADIQLECSCPAQLYYGGDYILSKPKYDAKYGDREDRAPNIRNPKQYGIHCKHLANLFKALPFYADTVAKWLNDFYPELIGEVEAKAGAEAEKFKRAGEELKKRKVTKEKPVRKPERPAKAEEEPRVAKPKEEPEKEPEDTEEPKEDEPERKVEPEKEEPEREEEPQKEEERPAKAQEPKKEDLPKEVEEPEEEKPEDEDEDDDKKGRKIWTA